MNANLSSPASQQLMVRVAATACTVSFCLVLLDRWDNRDLFNPGGITYLDMADAYLRGEWRAALIGLWSPLYPGLLALMMFFFNPAGQWEFTAGRLNYARENGLAMPEWQRIDDTNYHVDVF